MRVMWIRELIGRPVVDRTTARVLGITVDAFFDTTATLIVALEVASSGRESGERVPAESITRIGNRAVMVERRSDSEPIGAGHTLDHWLNYRSLMGLEVLDEDGDRVGHLHNARVDPERLSISIFQLAGAGWRRWLNLGSVIRPEEVCSCSRDLMLVKGRRAHSHARAVA